MLFLATDTILAWTACINLLLLLFCLVVRLLRAHVNLEVHLGCTFHFNHLLLSIQLLAWFLSEPLVDSLVFLCCCFTRAFLFYLLESVAWLDHGCYLLVVFFCDSTRKITEARRSRQIHSYRFSDFVVIRHRVGHFFCCGDSTIKIVLWHILGVLIWHILGRDHVLCPLYRDHILGLAR